MRPALRWLKISFQIMHLKKKWLHFSHMYPSGYEINRSNAGLKCWQRTNPIMYLAVELSNLLSLLIHSCLKHVLLSIHRFHVGSQVIDFFLGDLKVQYIEQNAFSSQQPINEICIQMTKIKTWSTLLETWHSVKLATHCTSLLLKWLVSSHIAQSQFQVPPTHYAIFFLNRLEETMAPTRKQRLILCTLYIQLKLKQRKNRSFGAKKWLLERSRISTYALSRNIEW